MSRTDGAASWKRVEDLFYAAVALDPAEREGFLLRNCGDDSGLRAEVESLIAFSGQTIESLRAPVEWAAQSVARREAGQQMGPYRLLRLLGDGGMGQVYLAERSDQLYEQQVAIKLMHGGVKQTGAMLLRFSAERQILANLNHPNIGRLLDAGITAEGVPYLVMEYVDGLHIDEYCRQHELGTREILQLFTSVCSAVEYAHKNLVIHRDIKPANIIVDGGGVPKLLDFGIAKLLEAEEGDAVTRVTEQMMTPEYASPEQVRGETVTTSADVYALGILLFELLAGRRPFRLETKSPLEIVQVICEQDPEPPSAVMRKTASSGRGHLRKADSDLDNIVLMAMRKEPSRRYASVSALAADVQAYLSGYPVRARTDRWSYRSQKFIRRHRAAAAAAALVTLSLIAFSIGMGVLAGRANRARLAAEREAEFLNTIFQAATPDQAKGATVTARDLLDQGVKRIDSELGGQPEVQATMLDNVGRAYSSIGLYGQAASLLERAFQIRRRILARDSLETVSTEDALATALRLDGHYAQAEPYFRDALNVRKQRLGSNDGIVADSMSNLGECLYWEDRTAEAESLLRQALNIDRRLNRGTGVSTRNYLALVLERSGDFPAAAQLLREAVDMEQRSKGTDSAAYMVSLHNYAGALIDSGDLNAAENTERQVLALREKVFGSDHPDVFYPLNNLGFILLEKGEWQQAMPVLDRSVALIRKVGIPVKLANALGNRARGFGQKGDYAAADRDLQEAMKIMSGGGEQKSWVAAKITASAGSLELEKGNYAVAAEKARAALKMERELGGEGTPSYAGALMVLGDGLSLAGDPGAAESAYREALLIRRKKFNSGNPVIAVTETRLGEALIRANKAEDAEPLLREAAASLAAIPFPLPTWSVAEANFALGKCLEARGRRAEGEQMMRSSESGLRSHPQGPFRWPAIARAMAVTPR